MSKKGKTGLLSPDGEWFPCKWGEHFKIARKITVDRGGRVKSDYDLRQEEKWLSFGFRGFFNGESESYIFANWNVGATEAQIEWIKKNFNRLSEEQQHDAELLFWTTKKAQKNGGMRFEA